MKTTFSLLFLLPAIAGFAQHGPNRGNDRDRRDNRYQPRRSVSVDLIARLPFGAMRVHWGGRPYYYGGGYYYEPWDRGYRRVSAPIGIIVPSLPPGGVVIVIGGRSYYRYESAWYQPGYSGYEVIPEPIAPAPAPVVIQSSQPAAPTDNGYEKIIIEGRTYYRRGDTYYKATVSNNGEIAYSEVGKMQ
jgi:hypothetical protein